MRRTRAKPGLGGARSAVRSRLPARTATDPARTSAGSAPASVESRVPARSVMRARVGACRVVGVVIVSAPSEETKTRTRRPPRGRLLPDPAPSPRKAFPAGSRRTGFLARGSSSPGPFPPRGSGSDRVRPPLQLRGSEGLPPSSLARLGSGPSYDRGRELSMEKDGRRRCAAAARATARRPRPPRVERSRDVGVARPTPDDTQRFRARTSELGEHRPHVRLETVNRSASRSLAVAPHARC